MANGFTKKKVGTLTLGEKLKKIRGEKRISLNEVSRITKIRLEYLEYLEAGAYQKLPADVYVRGFLKSYADFLLLDERILIKLYEKEKGIKKNLEKGKNDSQKKIKKKAINISIFIFTPKKIFLFLALALVAFIFVYLYREVGSLTNTPQLVILSPENNSKIGENTVLLIGKTDKDARVLINDQLVLVDDNGKFQENIAMQQGINVIHIRAVNKFQKETAENITVQAQYAEKNSDGTDSTNQSNGQSEHATPDLSAQTMQANQLQMEINVEPGPVWISVKADGNMVFSGEMLSGAIQKFSALNEIIVGSGMANATFVKLNGKDLGQLGSQSGMIDGVVFGKDGKK